MLPMKWQRIGGVERDSTLEVDLAGIRLRNPVGLAAGFDKSCRVVTALGEIGFGYVVGGTITRRPRRGNPRPRIVRDRERSSMVNAMGMPNPGSDTVARTLAGAPRTAPRLVSLADEGVEDALATARALEPLVDG